MKQWIVVSAVVLSGVGQAEAGVITDPGALHPDATILDFESLAVGTSLPLYDGFVHITSSLNFFNQFARVIASQSYYVQIPGVVEGHLVGHYPVDYFIEFDQPVSQFGMGIFDPNFAGNVLRAVDSAGNTLEEVTSGTTAFPVGPTGGSFATYVGFVRPTNDISRIELIHVFSTENSIGDFLSIDNVTYYAATTPTDVPEPASMTLSLLGGLCVGGRKLRRRFSAA